MTDTCRRILIAFGLFAAAAGCGTNSPGSLAQSTSAAWESSGGDDSKCDAGASDLPVQQIEDIVGAQGSVSHGVLDIEIERQDIGDVQGPLGVTFTPSFEIHGDLHFQPLGGGQAFLNGDMALLPNEVNPFIAALLTNHLVFQAFHQHMIEMTPQIWFVHFRGVGDALQLATEIRAAIDVTATPLPQMHESNPSTPLDPDRLARILHGEAMVGDEGVVTVTVQRTDRIRIDSVIVSPEAGISTTIEFKPLGGAKANVVPDFSMKSNEVDPVVRAMLIEQGWFQGCLYNQETDEHPQLYFDHMLKTGNAYELAREIRRGLDLTNSE